MKKSWIWILWNRTLQLIAFDIYKTKYLFYWSIGYSSIISSITGQTSKVIQYLRKGNEFARILWHTIIMNSLVDDVVDHGMDLWVLFFGVRLDGVCRLGYGKIDHYSSLWNVIWMGTDQSASFNQIYHPKLCHEPLWNLSYGTCHKFTMLYGMSSRGVLQKNLYGDAQSRV